MIILTVFEVVQCWIDKYANWYTFFGLLVGIIGVILTIYFSKIQAKNAKMKQDADIYAELNEPYLGVTLKIDHVFRKFVGYGASCGEIIQAGNFKANYEVEAELTITIQNESPNTIYGVVVSYIPNQNTQRYTLTDTRENKLQPLEGNKYFDFKLRIMNEYFDMYAQDVDKEFGSRICKVGKGLSFLNGSQICINYKDAKHKTYTKTEVLV